ncbi:LuxQ periplasmic sensor domain-containing protein [Vibrio inusitatus]|uniref:LuxQ periplasmic sensor domain-containing protein n=1 Tax=Vibrio inusitatus TaxID=413402 RepID=UPI001FCB71C2|nr:LuxQ periplasmic sensor domain-containing protein [Vibrio inusitatus]
MSWFFVILGFFFYNYQLSTKTYESERERNFNQTARVVKQLIESRLQTIQVTQDISSKSRTLIELFNAKDYSAVDNYMLELEELDPDGAADFRFMYQYGEVVWEDGNAAFYGFSPAHLKALGETVDFSNSWYFIVPSTELGNKHVIIRRSALIHPDSSELVGYYYVVFVIDNNLRLLRNLVLDSIVTDIVFVESGEIIAASSPKVSNLLKQYSPLKLEDQPQLMSQMIGEIDVVVEGIVTPVKAIFIQNSSKLDRVEISFAASLMLALFAITASAVIITKMVQRRVEREIKGVMYIADSFDSAKKSISFKGSNIVEFDRLGHTLQASIRREKQKETSFKNLFEFSLLPTALLNSEKHVLELNQAAIDAFSHDRGAAALKKELDTHLDHVLKSQQNAEVDTHVGEQIYRWSIAPILVDGASPTLVVQGKNITQFVEAEQQSERARQEAEQTALARAEFLAKVSHEIRTPLNGILGMAQLLKQGAISDEQKHQTLVLHQSSEHLLNLLNDILDFSRIDKGGVVIEFSEFSLNRTIETIESFAEPSCLQKGLKFVVNRNFSDDVTVRSDQMRLTQIFLNLLTNAIKFTSKGAVVVNVELRNRLADRAELYFSVTDTGIGIGKDNLDTIFASFMQAETHISREYGGSGLGLSIVKSLVNYLEGKVSVESQLGNGSCFSITIPILTVEQKPSLPEIINEKSIVFERELKVLLVEDNKTNAFVIQALGKKHGLVFEWVTDGVQAIEKAQHNYYDLILMDNQMPNMDGIEATDKLRAEFGLSTPIIACTADGYQSTADAFLAAGANAVLVKPILEENLVLTLRKVMENT